MYADDKSPAAQAPSGDRRTVKVYERILELFEAEGIKTVFGIPDPNYTPHIRCRPPGRIPPHPIATVGPAKQMSGTKRRHEPQV